MSQKTFAEFGSAQDTSTGEDDKRHDRCLSCGAAPVGSVIFDVPDRFLESSESTAELTKRENGAVESSYCEACLLQVSVPGSLSLTDTEVQKDYQSTCGRPPLGYSAEGGELIRTAEFDEIRTVVKQVLNDDLSVRQASQRLDCSWSTVNRIVTNESKLELYDLRSPRE
jgi:hypothetical protein